jgi:hypothetical protein
MTPELQAFIDFFESEKKLRSAIEALLSRRQECSGVRQLHGSDEAGKDLVFHAPIGLGRLALNACVIKLDKITGSASDPRTGARNVLIQCEQAIDTPVVNTQGKEEWVNHVLVMSPNELSASAMQSVSGQFRGKPSQIEFICGHDLLQLFKTCWPDFIFFEPDLLSAHLESLGKELQSDENIHRLGIAHGLSTGSQLRNVYVEPILSQARGQLSRGVELPDNTFFSRMDQISEVSQIASAIEKVAESLRVTDYLPESYHSRRDSAAKQLRAWKKQFEEQWFEAFNQARSQAHALKKDPPRSVPVPKAVVRSFLRSSEFEFVVGVYRELDERIARSNESTCRDVDRAGILDSPSFATYGSLVQSVSDCFPVVKFESEDRIEWRPDEVLSVNRNVLVTAAPGYGKTSFCRNHFLRDLERFKTGISSILPLYFAAHSLKVQDGETFEDIFIRPEVCARLARDSQLSVRVYLDGLDEIKSTGLRDRILAIAKDGCASEQSRFRCVATARDHIGGFATSWLSRVSISPMSKENLQNLVTAWLDGDAELISAFYSELSVSESLTSVLQVPLLATLTVLVFKNLHRLPENRLRLYQMFIDLLLGGWNLAKGLQRTSRYSSTAKQSVLTRLAGLMHARKEKECGVSRISAAFTQVAPALIPELQLVVSELVEDGLLLPTGRATYVFPHLSFQEYLAAKDAIDPARVEERRIVQSFLNGDDWFKEVAIFIVSMTTNAPRMRKWIVDLAKPTSSSERISDSERRAGFLIAKISEIFPECRVIPNETGDGY